MEEYSIGLALFDYLPNIAFLVGVFYLVKIARLTRGTRCSRMVMAGATLIALGGMLKATWKLIYAAGGPDITLMSQVQFALVAPGFVAVLVAAILIARGKRSGAQAKSPQPGMLAIAGWKIPLLFVMTLASLGAYGILTYMAFRRKAPLAAAGFILAFMGVLAMGGMATAEQTVSMQWVEESINSIGQLGFMSGSILLYRNYKLSGGECETEAV